MRAHSLQEVWFGAVRSPGLKKAIVHAEVSGELFSYCPILHGCVGVGRYCRVAMKRCAENGVRGRLKSFQTASPALLCKVVSARWMLCIAMAVPDYSAFVYFRSGCSKW